MTENENDADDWQKRAEAAEAELVAVRGQADARLIHAELKAEAIKAGMVDLDGLKLIDTSEIRLNEAGDVQEAGAILNRLKRAKPWLFGNASSSSAAAHPPRPEPPRIRQANELSHAEWQAARAALIRRR